MFVDMMLGFRKKGNCLKLPKTRCGLRRRPRVFLQYLTKTINAGGTAKSALDPYTFICDREHPVAFVVTFCLGSLMKSMPMHCHVTAEDPK
jgi:hypothetical protein